MSSDSFSPALPSETDVLKVSPFTGLAACTAPTASQPSPAMRPRVVQNDPHSHYSVSEVNFGRTIGYRRPTFALRYSDIVTTEPLEYASPLTEGALRYQRRDALRAAQDVVALISPHGTVSSNAILQNIVPAKFPELYRSNLTFTSQRNAPVLGKLHEYSMAATIPRVTKPLLAEQPPFTAAQCAALAMFRLLPPFEPLVACLP